MNRKKTSLRIAAGALLAALLISQPAWAQTVTSGSSGKTYSASSGGENAVLVSGSSVSLKNTTVTKTGSSSGENADFTGSNAAILVTNGGSLSISGDSTITTDGEHANAVFAYGSGSEIQISDAVITTKSNTSGGIMVTGGGELTASNLTVNTSGNSSAAIRSDRGGGTMTVNGGTYSTSGNGSPAIYSTADVTVSDAKLTSSASEGVVIEGANSVTLKNCTVYDNNCRLNGQSETYKNIFLYQSMSGDASVGTAVFRAENSDFTTVKGDTFYVTNTTASIFLSGNTFTNDSGDFLRAEAAAWGRSGSNGGNVTLNASGQVLKGNIIVDSISSLQMTLADGSTYTGAINPDGAAGTVGVVLKSGCTWTLTGDSYISSLTADSGQINTNGHKLYVNGKEVAGTLSDAAPAKGSVLKDAKGSTYTVTKAGSSGSTTGTVSFTAPSSKDITSVSVPAAVTIDGIRYKVTAVSKKAFAGCAALKTVTIGKNVRTIGAQAFAGCTAIRKVTLGKSVSVIGKKAFYGCSSLKTLVIRSSLLTAAGVKSKAFAGTPASVNISVPKAKLSAYKKILKKKGISGSAVWKKL